MHFGVNQGWLLFQICSKPFMKTLLILAVCLISQISQAQTCFDKYVKAFYERGAEDIKDSTYSEVVISVRDGNSTDCFVGQVTVRAGKVLVDQFYVQLADDSYENVASHFKTTAPVEIKNGVSQIILDKRDRIYNVIFATHLKPRKQAYKRAPDPDIN
jgi:hypothetical protein